MEGISEDIVKDVVKDVKFAVELVDVGFQLDLLAAVATPIIRDVVLLNILLKVVLFVIHSGLANGANVFGDTGIGYSSNSSRSMLAISLFSAHSLYSRCLMSSASMVSIVGLVIVLQIQSEMISVAFS
jgi:hypothetical protein